MPLKHCQKAGKPGWKWGDRGVCYSGPSGKARALRQARAIKASKKRRGVVNVASRAKNPLKIDPTRTSGERRRFAAELASRFARLRLLVADLVEKEDAFGLGVGEKTIADLMKEPKQATLILADNAFCPTGEGGGIDPSCGKGKKSGKAASGKKAKVKESAAPEDPQARAVRSYKQAGATSINRYLRTGKAYSQKDKEEIEETVKHLDSAINTAGPVSHSALYRGVGLLAWLDGDMPDPATLKPGDTFPERGYASTSTNQKNAARFADGPEDVILRIRPTSGVRGVETDRFVQGQQTEGEVLLQRGLMYTVRGVQVIDGRRVIDVDASPGPTGNVLAANQRWRFLSTPDKVQQFTAWLRTQIGTLFRGQTVEQLWRRYIEQGFRKGAGRAFDDTRRSQRVREEGRQPLGFYEGTRDEFLRSAFAQPVALEKVQLLAGRGLTDLAGVTEQMATVMTRTLTDGLVRGASPREVARDLVKNVDGIGRVRAEMIARSEIIRAHAEGQLTAMEQLGVESVGVMAEWLTTGDRKVCGACSAMEGVVLKISEVRGLIPRHPSCRCSWTPAQTGESPASQKRTAPAVRRAVAKSAAAAGDDFAVEVSGQRPKSILNADQSLLEFSRLLANAFCPTGEGGGVDPSCSPGKGPGAMPDKTALVAKWVKSPDAMTTKDKILLSEAVQKSQTSQPQLIRVSRTDPKWREGQIVELDGPTATTGAVASILAGKSAGSIGWKSSDKAMIRVDNPRRGLDVDYEATSSGRQFDVAGEQETIIAGRYRVKEVVQATEPGTLPQYDYRVPMYVLEEVR